MTICIAVNPKTYNSTTVFPAGDYPCRATALADLAVALTEHKIAYEGKLDPLGFKTTLKHARDLSHYENVGYGCLYEDSNIHVLLSASDDHVDRTQRRIFCDSDGVFAHFDKQVPSITGQTITELGDDRMWELVGNDETFWRTMPVMPDAERLWAAVQPFSPAVLTGCPKTAYGLSAALKKDWWKRSFDHDDVYTCLSRDKALFCEVPGDVLIDDFYHNIKRWRVAGGIGILHKSVDQTLDELRNLLII